MLSDTLQGISDFYGRMTWNYSEGMRFGCFVGLVYSPILAFILFVENFTNWYD